MCPRLHLVVLDEHIFAPFSISACRVWARGARRSLWFLPGDLFRVPSTPLSFRREAARNRATVPGIVPEVVLRRSCDVHAFVVDDGAAEKSYEEIVDLVARGSGSGAVLAFRPSEDARARMRALLPKSKTDALTEDEQAELDRFGELERLMQLVKARARRLSRTVDP